MLAAPTAAAAGWKIVYPGPDLPAEDVAAIAERVGAPVVALSVVYPAGGSSVVSEVRRLRMVLPPDVALLVGGRAAEGYRRALEELDVELVQDLPGLRQRLGSAQASGGCREKAWRMPG